MRASRGEIKIEDVLRAAGLPFEEEYMIMVILIFLLNIKVSNITSLNQNLVVGMDCGSSNLMI